MTRLVIDRAKWGRGHYYWTAEKDPCCALGWVMASQDVKLPPGTMYLWGQIETANDNMPDGPEREQRITELFAQAGVSVEYVGEYPR